MSTKYRESKDVPTSILCERMNVLSNAITRCDSGKALLRETTMRIPAELDHDADLILAEASRRLRKITEICWHIRNGYAFETCKLGPQINELLDELDQYLPDERPE